MLRLKAQKISVNVCIPTVQNSSVGGKGNCCKREIIDEK